MSTVLVAVDAGTTDVGGAEHLVALLDTVLPADLPAYVASTHVVPGGRTAVACSWEGAHLVDGDELLAAVGADSVLVQVDGADRGDAGPEVAEAARQHATRSAGRLVRYAGRADVERRLTVDEVLRLTPVDEVRAVGLPVLAGDTVVDLTEWARPTWQAGRTVLLVQQASTGLVPFESRVQIACCADH